MPLSRDWQNDYCQIKSFRHIILGQIGLLWLQPMYTHTTYTCPGLHQQTIKSATYLPLKIAIASRALYTKMCVRWPISLAQWNSLQSGRYGVGLTSRTSSYDVYSSIFSLCIATLCPFVPVSYLQNTNIPLCPTLWVFLSILRYH